MDVRRGFAETTLTKAVPAGMKSGIPVYRPQPAHAHQQGRKPDKSSKTPGAPMKERPLIRGEVSAEAAAGSAYHVAGLEEAGFKPTLE